MSLPRPVTGGLDGGEDQFDGLLVGSEIGGEAALVADVGGEVAFLENLLQVVEGLHPGPQVLGEGEGQVGDDHELLDIQVVGGVLGRR